MATGQELQFPECFCAEDILPVHSIRIPDACQHVYHDECLEQWIEDKPVDERSCPYCRGKILTRTLFHGESIIDAIPGSINLSRPSEFQLSGLELGQQLKVTLRDVHPNPHTSDLNPTQRLELIEFRYGRDVRATPVGEPLPNTPVPEKINRTLYKELKSQHVEHWTDTRSFRQQLTSNLLNDFIHHPADPTAPGHRLTHSHVVLAYEVTPQFQSETANPSARWQKLVYQHKLDMALEISERCYFLRPWCVIITNELGHAMFAKVQMYPLTWTADMVADHVWCESHKSIFPNSETTFQLSEEQKILKRIFEETEKVCFAAEQEVAREWDAFEVQTGLQQTETTTDDPLLEYIWDNSRDGPAQAGDRPGTSDSRESFEVDDDAFM